MGSNPSPLCNRLPISSQYERRWVDVLVCPRQKEIPSQPFRVALPHAYTLLLSRLGLPALFASPGSLRLGCSCRSNLLLLVLQGGLLGNVVGDLLDLSVGLVTVLSSRGRVSIGLSRGSRAGGGLLSILLLGLLSLDLLNLLLGLVDVLGRVLVCLHPHVPSSRENLRAESERSGRPSSGPA